MFSEKSDEDYIQAARDNYAFPSDDNIVVQELGTDYAGNLEIVDRVDGGAWVMAWLYVRDEETDS